jgi:hypothetical protein
MPGSGRLPDLLADAHWGKLGDLRSAYFALSRFLVQTLAQMLVGTIFSMTLVIFGPNHHSFRVQLDLACILHLAAGLAPMALQPSA